MLNYLLPKLKENKFLLFLNKFLYSDLFIIVVNILMLLSYFFSLEIAVYYTYMILGLTIILFSDDMLPTVPMICTGYMTISKFNSPIKNKESLLFSKTFFINILIIGIIIFIALVTRLIFDIIYRKPTKKPKLTIGFIIVTLVMMLGGIGTDQYSFRTVLYGLLVGVTLSVCYFYLFYTINWKNVRKDYIAFMFMVIGLAVGLQVLECYITFDWNNLEFHRSTVYAGWGIYNNVGGVICTCIGGAFYLSVTRKRGWLYTILGILVYAFVVLSQSRNAILVGTLLLFISFIFVFAFSDKQNRIGNLLVIIGFLFTVIILLGSFEKQLSKIFIDLINRGLDDSGRFEIYLNGLKAYISSPIIGTGFYDYNHAGSMYFEESSFLAPRYHNTIIQFLATSGTIGILGYLFHRFQTLKLVFKKCSIEKLFLAVCFAAIIGNSLLDCQMFNFGPGLHYGTILVFMERLYKQNKLKDR